MNYTVEIEIDLPRARVIELFDNPDNLPKWQPELVSFEHISGERGTPGAKSRLLYKVGKREFDMIETITVRKLPDEFSGTYETHDALNTVKNRFIETGPGKTKWISENEFQCKGFMKILAFLMPGMFKKQSWKYMEQFKAFAEGA